MNRFQKPTVTIELEEYNELQGFKSKFASLKLVDYSDAIRALLRVADRNMTLDQTVDMVNRELERDGLALSAYGLQVDQKIVCEVYRK